VLEAVVDATSQNKDSVQTLRVILPYALALAEAEVGALLVVDDGGNNRNLSLVGVARQSVSDDLLRELTTGELAARLLKGQPVYAKSQALQLDPQQALLVRHKLKYLIGLPLQTGNDITGALFVGSRADSSLVPPELQQRLSILARLVAMFLENVRLRAVSQPHRPAAVENMAAPATTTAGAPEDLEELLAAVMSAEEEVASHNKDLGLLNALSSEVSSTLQLSAVLQKAIERTRAALDGEAGWVYLFEDNALTLLEQQGLSDRYVQDMKRLKLGDGVEGMAFSRNQPFLRDGLLFHSGKTRTLVEAEGLRAVAAAPLRSQGKPFGVLAVACRWARDWSARDERMLMSIGQQVAHAIINSQQFAQAQSKAQDWESNYHNLQQANNELARRAEALERQIQELQRIEQQIWTALAASQAARRRFERGLTVTDTLDGGQQSSSLPWRKTASSSIDKQLAATLRKVLASMKKEK
jgi:transcriptional regulator with GAF, ATPase, and Fis domain